MANLICEKKTISILPGNLNSGLSYLIATVCNVKDSTHGLTSSQFSWILNFHESFLDKLYYFQTTSILKINHKLFVKTNFLTRSTSGPPHILSSLLNNEVDFFWKYFQKNFFGGQMSVTSFLESSMKVNIEYRFSINSFRWEKCIEVSKLAWYYRISLYHTVNIIFWYCPKTVRTFIWAKLQSEQRLKKHGSGYSVDSIKRTVHLAFHGLFFLDIQYF